MEPVHKVRSVTSSFSRSNNDSHDQKKIVNQSSSSKKPTSKSCEKTTKEGADTLTIEYRGALSRETPDIIEEPEEEILLLNQTQQLQKLGKNKPTISEFMKASGVDYHTARSILYETATEKLDVRNWDKIMNSAFPLRAAKLATRALFDPKINKSLVAREFDQLPPPFENVAQSTNLIWAKDHDTHHLFLSDGVGNILRKLALDTTKVQTAMEDFGFDVCQVADLLKQLKNAGIEYRPFKMFPKSGDGVDFEKMLQNCKKPNKTTSKGSSH